MADLTPAESKETSVIKVLLVQDNPEYAAYLNKNLPENILPVFVIHPVATVSQALKSLGEEKFDAILLELSLPDSSGLGTFKAVRSAAPSTPIVVLTYLDDEILALQAVREGAQDYLLKSDIDGKLLRRVVLYGIERQRMQMQLFSLSIIDDLTGFYNRRGFMILAEQQMKLASRAKKGLLLFMGDLDGLKQINDVHGHPQGDLAIKKTAEILRQSFRKSDILARLGGDEFAVIAIEAGDDEAEIMRSRLEANLQEFNRREQLPYPLSLSIGYAHFDTQNAVFVEQLIAQADQKLYAAKKLKNRVLNP